MKKHVLIIIYSLILIFYPVYLFLFNVTMGTNMWIGMIFVAIAYGFSLFTSIMSESRKLTAFPTNVSLIVLSSLYLIGTMIINNKYGTAIIVGRKIYDIYTVRSFLIYEFTALLIFYVVYMIVYINKKHTIKINSERNKNIINVKELLLDTNVVIEKSKKLIDSEDLKKKLENLYEDIRFSNINSENSEEEMYLEIKKLLNRLDNEITNAIEIETSDYSSIDDLIGKIKTILVKNK